DLKGLVAWMKANPGKATLVDQNAAAKLGGIQLQQATGTRLEFIPFRGAGPAMQAMLGGQVDLPAEQRLHGGTGAAEGNELQAGTGGLLQLDAAKLRRRILVDERRLTRICLHPRDQTLKV